MLTARDLMQTSIHYLSAREAFARVMTELLRHDVECVLVPPEAQWREFGIVTKHDLLACFNSRRRNPWRLRVADVMSSPVITVPPAQTLVECANLLIEHGISNLPVFNDGQAVGVLTANQVFVALKNGVRHSGGEHAKTPVAAKHVARRLEDYVANPEALADTILADLVC